MFDVLKQGRVILRRTVWSVWTFLLLLVIPPCLFRLAFGNTDNTDPGNTEQDTDMNQGSCFADSCSARVAAYKNGVLKDGEEPSKISDAEWEKRLTPEQYHVARHKGTESPFTGNYYHHHEKGIYTCACCGAELFDSSTKYESGSGWPSFFMAKGANGRDDSMTNISRHTDDTHGMRRVEVTCRKCAAHLGHVFPDGPDPTGLRYCINSASLGFKPAE